MQANPRELIVDWIAEYMLWLQVLKKQTIAINKNRQQLCGKNNFDEKPNTVLTLKSDLRYISIAPGKACSLLVELNDFLCSLRLFT